MDTAGLVAALRHAVERIAGECLADIRTGYPKTPRRVSGYNLDSLLPENGFDVAKAPLQFSGDSQDEVDEQALALLRAVGRGEKDATVAFSDDPEREHRMLKAREAGPRRDRAAAGRPGDLGGRGGLRRSARAPRRLSARPEEAVRRFRLRPSLAVRALRPGLCAHPDPVRADQRRGRAVTAAAGRGSLRRLRRRT
ncbi:hypothetical protein GCM10010252_30870 [Streptomyces aureoverticillatus]|nr:hypothetical protein GCM10010252_30870 [Streptomyces aureoverticillatus]